MSKQKPDVNYQQVLVDSGMPTTAERIKAEFTEEVEKQGYITNTSKMSPFWRLITAIVTKPVLWLWQVLAETVLKNLFVATATGKFLDLHAWSVNLERKPATLAQGVISFMKIDSQLDVIVKAGTKIQTERINGIT